MDDVFNAWEEELTQELTENYEKDRTMPLEIRKQELSEYRAYCIRKRDKANIRRKFKNICGLRVKNTKSSSKSRLKSLIAPMEWRFWSQEVYLIDHAIRRIDIELTLWKSDITEEPMDVDLLETLQCFDELDLLKKIELRNLMKCFRAAPTCIYETYFTFSWETNSGYEIGLHYGGPRNNRWQIWEVYGKGERVEMFKSEENMLIQSSSDQLKAIQSTISSKLAGHCIKLPIYW